MAGDATDPELPHEWTFTGGSAGRGDEGWAIAIAICTLCGEVRGAAVNQDNLDLSGDCPWRVRRSQDLAEPLVG